MCGVDVNGAVQVQVRTGPGKAQPQRSAAIESSRQRPCTGPGTESVSQTRAAAQNRLLAVPFQQDIAFMHIHVANDHYRHASQTTKSSCGAPTADRRVSEAATGPRSQLPGGRYVHGVEVTSRIRPWRRMNANGACQFGEGGGGARQHNGRRVLSSRGGKGAAAVQQAKN